MQLCCLLLFTLKKKNPIANDVHYFGFQFGESQSFNLKKNTQVPQTSKWLLPSAPNVKVKKFNEARVSQSNHNSQGSQIPHHLNSDAYEWITGFPLFLPSIQWSVKLLHTKRHVHILRNNVSYNVYCQLDERFFFLVSTIFFFIRTSLDLAVLLTCWSSLYSAFISDVKFKTMLIYLSKVGDLKHTWLNKQIDVSQAEGTATRRQACF